MLRNLLAATALLVSASGAIAHHTTLGFYDPEVIVEIEGVLKSLSMRNPHVEFVVTVTDPDGEAVDWQVQTSALSVLRAKGIEPDFMEVGDRIRVAGPGSRRGLPELNARNVLLEDGTEVMTLVTAAPYFTAERSDLLEPVFSASVEAEARRTAEGIFRVWSTVMGDPASFPLFKGNYPLTEAAEQARAAWEPDSEELLACWSKGMPHLMITPVPIEFERMGDDIRLRFEEDDTERVIHMSAGDSPPEGYSMLGYSTGRWEGNMLVVETANIDAPRFDDRGVPQSRDISLVERFTLSEDESRLDYRVTITDPANFTEPFDLTRYWMWRPGIPLGAWNCGEPQEVAASTP